jgi:hypothetical protein
MTVAALAARGPRTVLARDNRTDKLVYFQENQQPAGDFSAVAKSYSMSYLRKLEKFNR